MKWAVMGLVLVAATACTSTARETLFMADGTPVIVAVSGGQTCIEVGEAADLGGWCARQDKPDTVWLGAASVGDGLVVVGQAPAEVASVALEGDGGVHALSPEQSGHGRFFVALGVEPGDYGVSAQRADGTEYVTGDTSFSGVGTSMTTITP